MRAFRRDGARPAITSYFDALDLANAATSGSGAVQRTDMPGAVSVHHGVCSWVANSSHKTDNTVFLMVTLSLQLGPDDTTS